MKRYEIRLASLDPSDGTETVAMGAVVIVSLDALNDRLEMITVCPLTTMLHPAWRCRLGVRSGRRDAEIAVDQIRTIRKARLGKKVGTLSERDAGALRRLITEMYGE